MANQVFLGRAAGGLDLNEASGQGAGTYEQVCRLGGAELLVQIDGLQARFGQHHRNGTDWFGAGAIKQPVPLGNPVSCCELGFCCVIRAVAATTAKWCCRLSAER
ncbi:hypothetical protein [Nonomuraea angiospora]|uniref:hypothetical protein n=1 Tax=Nonomuraea angiospora TaxID=46172 RepID=UPI0029AE50A1|nr:hypothetical protein [Nonomuraea angiospora]MDX3103717.1 hypothetical protein [Nonomuraea angiospora]